MDNGSKTLLKGLLAVLTLFVANEQIRSSAQDTNKMLLMGIISVLTLVFSSNEIINTVQDASIKKYIGQEDLATTYGSYENALQMISSSSKQDEPEVVINNLTPRETEVLNYMAEGLINKDIAKKLYISDATVKNHVTSVLRKLNATVRTEAVVTAIKRGMVKGTRSHIVS
jgi:DNA-binding NarL/FixJ family response regulator